MLKNTVQKKTRKKDEIIMPILLTTDEKSSFEELYRNILIFASIYKKELLNEEEDEDEKISRALMNDRIFFYENRKDILKKYREEKILLKKDKEILSVIENARFEKVLVSYYDSNYAVILDDRDNVYLIEAIDLPLVCSFTHEQDEYAYVQTALMKYKNRYISDGIFLHFKFSLDKKTKEQIKILIGEKSEYKRII